MTIRTYLLRILLPGLIAFIIFTGWFFYLYSSYKYASLPEAKTLAAVAGLGMICSCLYLFLRSYFFAESLKANIQVLTDESLSIAAGDYKALDPIDGPQEIKELSNAMQTMSDCLQENTARLRESSALRERMHGEYECAVLLQHYMLHSVLDEYNNPSLSIRPITYRSTTAPHGVFLKLLPNQITLCEAINKGFDGMYELLLQQQNCPKKVQLTFKDNFRKLEVTTAEMPEPIVWSMRLDKMISPSDNSLVLEKDDLIFLYNEGFAKCFDNPMQVQKWFHKVLRHFASEGIELFLTMLNCEVNFLTKKLHIDHDINILCIQIT